MLKIILTGLCMSAVIAAQAQFRPLYEEKWPEDDLEARHYTIKGYRHGPSYFPMVRHPHVEYVPGDVLSFDKYHTYNVIKHWMIRFAELYPDLVDIYEVGHSFEERPIVQMTITNKNTGPATQKPGAYIEGGRHSGEILTCESVMWLMRHLLENYGADEKITRIVDNCAVYLRPVMNPDGHSLFCHTAQTNRSSVRPFDQDGDGLLDEDPWLDLNGDGHITQMRVYDEKDGTHIIHPGDPSGRLMKQVGKGKGKYRIIHRESLDMDGDGKFGEDGIGGIDVHRNYLMNWRPISEKTGLGWKQIRPGEFPMSEPETKAVIMFLLENPNISVANSMDTNINVRFHGPATSPFEDMFAEDAKWYNYFDSIGQPVTNYDKARAIYGDDEKLGGGPIFGHSTDFGYFYYGAIWYNDELYDGGKAPKDYNGDGKIDALDRLIWNDEENEGIGFIDWTPYHHPQLGPVEIGGWDTKFMLVNPPSRFMEPWVEREAMFNILMIEHLPLIEWEDMKLTRLTVDNGQHTDYSVVVSYKNTGGLPTALRQADHVKIVRPDQVRLRLNLEDVNGTKPRAEILPGDKQTHGTPKSSPDLAVRNTGYVQPGEVKSVQFIVRVHGDHKVEGEVEVRTTRAGVLPPRKFTL